MNRRFLPSGCVLVTLWLANGCQDSADGRFNATRRFVAPRKVGGPFIASSFRAQHDDSSPVALADASLASSPATMNPTVAGLQAGISYHSGDVNVGVSSIYNVFYGDWSGVLPHSNALAVSIFNEFSSHIGQTPWYSILSTYWQTGGATPSSAVLTGSFFVQDCGYRKNLSYTAITDILRCGIRKGHIAATPGSSDNVYLFIVSEGG